MILVKIQTHETFTDIYRNMPYEQLLESFDKEMSDLFPFGNYRLPLVIEVYMRLRGRIYIEKPEQYGYYVFEGSCTIDDGSDSGPYNFEGKTVVCVSEEGVDFVHEHGYAHNIEGTFKGPFIAL